MTLVEQVQRACVNATGAVARLTNSELPEFAEDEKTFDDLQQRITETLSYLRGYSEEQFEGSETMEV